MIIGFPDLSSTVTEAEYRSIATLQSAAVA
jgi:hypothetical protein